MKHTDHREELGHLLPPLKFAQWVAIITPVLILSILAAPRLPQGVCFGDSGGLQLAAATWGITHPPGYAVYTSILHVLTWLLPFDPAYDVSLSCLVSGLGVVALCTLIQIRLGVNAWFAATLSLLFTAHPRVWSNFLAPEVYMPTLFFEVLVIYWLWIFSITTRRRMLWLASISLGIALANRPPVVFFIPFAALSTFFIYQKYKGTIRAPRRAIAIAICSLLFPIIYTGTYIILRDTPDAAYNYIEQYNTEMHVVPTTDLGFKAKCRRMIWLVSGAQFQSQMGNDWTGLKRKFRWIGHDLRRWLGDAHLGYSNVLFAAWLIFMISGAIFVWSKNSYVAVLLLGLAIQSIVFVCLYRIQGDAANTLPLLFSCSVLIGVSISKSLQIFGDKPNRNVPAIIFSLAIAFTTWHAPSRSHAGRNVDASDFLHKFDLNALAPDTVICSTWGTSTPLWYAKHVTCDRPDIMIINASSSAWPRMTLSIRHRPMIVVENQDVWHKPDW